MTQDDSAGQRSVPVTLYVPVYQREQWSEAADNRDMSVSKFCAAMVEAGRKQFGVEVTPDETNHELRQERNELKKELDRMRERNSRLEERLHSGLPEEIESFVEDNPGATYAEIVQHAGDSVPARVARALDELEGTSLRRDDDGYRTSAEPLTGQESPRDAIEQPR